MSLEIGKKVLPISKKAGHRDFDNCGTYYNRLEMGQEHLYVVGLYGFDKTLDEEVYWCNVFPYMGGDLYAETDLQPITKD
jgi:hypothetical protein